MQKKQPTKKMPSYFIKTFGCQMNVSDSERIAGFLDSQKFKSCQNIEKADLVVFNTCGIRQTAENSALGLIHNLKEKNPKSFVIVTGCLANRKDVQKKLKEKVDLFLSIQELFNIENWKIGNSKLEIPVQQDDKTLCSNYLSINPKYGNTYSAFVPIMTGCNNFCSYCVVPYARGREISRPIAEIFEEIERLSKAGYKEIILLGQNVNSYSYKLKIPILKLENFKLEIDWESKIKNWKFKHRSVNNVIFDFPTILNNLAKNYPNIHWRFLTSHPKDFSKELIKVIAKNPNISKEIHLPIQSGSNKILKLMNRPYTQEYYLKLIKEVKKNIPLAKFTTDVIVGFPGETERDFLQTVKVFKKVQYSLAFVNKYSPRPGTAAFKLGDPIEWKEKKRRAKILQEIIKSFQKN